MTTPQRAAGSFTVQMKPYEAPAEVPAGATPLARLALDKVFNGDMAGSSAGEMLTAVTPTAGSAAYVAIERFTGTVHGRQGSFVMQHSGTMSQRSGQQLSIKVVPDSGTDALCGIEGQLLLKIEQGQHHYTLEYTLPA
jgi:Protein of unknown function (DUF3224)